MKLRIEFSKKVLQPIQQASVSVKEDGLIIQLISYACNVIILDKFIFFSYFFILM